MTLQEYDLVYDVLEEITKSLYTSTQEFNKENDDFSFFLDEQCETCGLSSRDMLSKVSPYNKEPWKQVLKNHEQYSWEDEYICRWWDGECGMCHYISKIQELQAVDKAISHINTSKLSPPLKEYLIERLGVC